MEYRRLGSTGLDVSVLGFGMWPIGGSQRAGDYGTVSDDEAVAAIRRALDLGVTLFDTAPAYGNGRAEEILRLGLGDRARRSGHHHQVRRALGLRRRAMDHDEHARRHHRIGRHQFAADSGRTASTCC